MKRIGKIYLNFLFFTLALIFFLCVKVNAANLSLIAQDNKGNEIETVQVGQQFFLIAQSSFEPKKNTNLERYPVIKNLKNLEVLKESKRFFLNFLNGKEKKILQTVYSVRANEIGEINIVSTIDNNQTLISNTLLIKVINSKTDKTKNKEDLIFELFLPKKRVYVNEPVPFTIKITISKDKIILDDVFLPNIKSISKINLGQSKKESKIIDGQISTILAQDGFLYPKNIGKMNISFSANYRKKKKMEKNDIWNLMFQVGTQWKTKQMYSNNEELNVLPLPETDKYINGIGKFLKYSAKIDKNKFDQTKAAIMTLSILAEKNVNLEILETPEVKLSEELNIYPSKSEIEQIDYNGKKYLVKNFEMVIHANKPGQYKIIPQEFVYFDPESETIKTLKTDAIDITIEKNSNLKDAEQEHNSKLYSEQKKDDFEKIEDNEINNFSIENLSLKIPIWPIIPWYIFILFLLIPPFFLIYVNFYLVKLVFNKITKKNTPDNILKKLEQEIKILEKNKNVVDLYPLLKNRISKIFTDNEEILSDNDILLKIERLLNYEENKKWQNYYYRLQNLSIYSNKTNFEIGQDIFQETYFWIDKIRNLKKIKKSYSNTSLFFLLICFAQINLLLAEEESKILKQAIDLKYLKKFGIGLTEDEYLLLKEKLNQSKENKNDSIKKIENRLNLNFFFQVLTYIPIIILQIFFLLLWFSLFLSIYYKKRNLFLIFAVLLISISILLTIKIYFENRSEGLVKNKAYLYLGPGNDYPKVGELSFLDDVIILDKLDNWVKVKTNKDIGWTNSNEIQIIKK